MMKFNSIDEFAEYTDVDTLLDIQYHVNKALEQIRVDSISKSVAGSATANISIALYDDYFLLIEFNYTWDSGVFEDDEDVKLTVLTLDEWLDYYNEYKSQFKIVESTGNEE
jgi:hypothetical protein